MKVIEINRSAEFLSKKSPTDEYRGMRYLAK
jgi:hypothetical protein